MLFWKNLVFVLLAPGTVGVALPLWIVRGRAPSAGLAGAAGIALVALGAAVLLRCVWDFASFGRGTPAPIDAPKRLVMRGLYRFTRNPMYLGVLTIIVGWSALFRAPELLAYAACLGLVVHGFIVLYEEPHLARTFPAEYAEYRARVPRWLPRRP